MRAKVVSCRGTEVDGEPRALVRLPARSLPTKLVDTRETTVYKKS
jgi:hypothetical protein